MCHLHNDNPRGNLSLLGNCAKGEEEKAPAEKEETAEGEEAPAEGVEAVEPTEDLNAPMP